MQASASRTNSNAVNNNAPSSSGSSSGDAVGALRAQLHRLDAQLTDVNKLLAVLAADPTRPVKASPPVPVQLPIPQPSTTTGSKGKGQPTIPPPVA